jgi:glycosyltransferase involved in cell wall biosynthesis
LEPNKNNYIARDFSNVGRPSIISVGRITSAKRPDRFIELSTKFNKEFEWIWVGDGDTNIKNKLLMNARVTGWIPEKEVQNHLSSADIFLLLSDWEGLPFAAIEALSQGIPTLLWNFYGANSIIKDDLDWLICKDLNRVIENILLLLNSKDLRLKVSDESWSEIHARYNYAEYRSLLSAAYEID